MRASCWLTWHKSDQARPNLVKCGHSLTKSGRRWFGRIRSKLADVFNCGAGRHMTRATLSAAGIAEGNSFRGATRCAARRALSLSPSASRWRRDPRTRRERKRLALGQRGHNPTLPEPSLQLGARRLTSSPARKCSRSRRQRGRGKPRRSARGRAPVAQASTRARAISPPATGYLRSCSFVKPNLSTARTVRLSTTP